MEEEAQLYLDKVMTKKIEPATYAHTWASIDRVRIYLLAAAKHGFGSGFET